MIHEWIPNQRNRISFVLVDAGSAEVAGLGSTFTLEISKNSGAFSVGTGTKTEIGNGWYSYLGTTGDADTPGPAAIRVTGTGIVQQNLVYYVPTQAVVAALVGIDGAEITFRRGDTLDDYSITGLGDITEHSKLWFTVKRSKEGTDVQALIQIEETVGLIRINGEAADTPANGNITITEALAGNIAISLEEVETAKLPYGEFYYDVQVLISGKVTTLTEGTAIIPADVTRAVL